MRVSLLPESRQTGTNLERMMGERCKKEVYRNGQFRPGRCSRLAVLDGYCKQHHPDSEAERQRKAEERWEEQRKASATYQLVRALERNQELSKIIESYDEIAETLLARDELRDTTRQILLALRPHLAEALQ